MLQYRINQSHAHKTYIGIQEVILFFVTNKIFKSYAKDCLPNPLLIWYCKTYGKRRHLICDCRQQFNHVTGQVIFIASLLSYNNEL